MQAKHYAQALLRVLHVTTEGEYSNVMDQFKLLLKKRGHTKLFGAILRELAHELEAEERAVRVVIRSPKLLNASEQEVVLQKYRKVLPSSMRVKEKIDATLASGYVIESPNIRIDQSGKRALLELYRNIRIGFTS